MFVMLYRSALKSFKSGLWSARMGQFNVELSGFRNSCSVPASRTPIFTRRHLFRSIEETLATLRNFDNYSFLKLQPPSVFSRNSPTPNLSKNFWLHFSKKTENVSDKVEAWQHVASDLSEDQCKNSVEVDRFIAELSSILTDLTYLQLRDVAHSLTLLHTQFSRFSDLATHLDQSLTEKLEEILLSTLQSEDQIHCFLEVSYILLRWVMLTAHLRNNISSRDLTSAHNKLLVKKLLVDHIDILSPSQFVFAMFLVGISREYPGLPYQTAVNQGFPLPDALTHKLESVLPELKSTEVGIVCHGLHLTYLHLETRHRIVRNHLFQSIIDFPDRILPRNQLALASIAKTLKRRGAVNQTEVLQVIEKLEPHLDFIDCYPKLRVLQMCTSAKLPRSTLEPFICKILHNMESLNNLRLKDLEQLAFCLTYFQRDAELQPFLYKILSAVESCDWSDVRSGRSYVFLISHLAKAKVYSLPGIDSILSTANRCDMSDLQTDVGLANAIDFLFRLNIPILSDVGSDAAYVLKFIQRNRCLCENSLLQLIELDFIREMYNLQTKSALDHDKRTLLVQHFQSNARMENNVDTFHGKTLSLLYRDTKVLVSGKLKPRLGFPLPCSTSPSIILQSNHSKGSGAPENLNSNSGENTIVFIVPKKSEIGFDGELFGRCKIELEYLHNLGIPVKILNWKEYYAALKNRKNLSYLKRILNESTYLK